jgi:phosphonate transport system ATP-binding protein
VGAPPAPAVEARDLWFAYVRGRPVLRGVSLAVPAGRITMVLGASGSGKTTLLRLVKGLLRPQQGVIRVLGAPVRRPARGGRLDARVAYIPQQLGLVRSDTVLANTLTGAIRRAGAWRSLLRWFPSPLVDEAQATLTRLGIGHKATEPVRSLSGGERQRVAIARALMQRPRMLVADEFVSQLDAVTTAAILDIVRDIARGGVTVLMTAHDLDLVARYADRVVVLRAGEKVLDVPAAATDVGHLERVMAQ